MIKDRTALKEGEHHPAALDALAYVNALDFQTLCVLRESFASCAIDGNRMAEICGGTLQRVMDGEGVGERYILGLAWYIRNMDEVKEAQDE